MQRYWIPGHVHVRILQDIVWFNEKANKYWTVDGSAGPILAQSVHGWPAVEAAEPMLEITNEQREALVNGLIAKGLLSEQLGDGRRYSSVSDVGLDSSADFDCRLGQREPIRWRHIVHVALAFAWALIAFRVLGLRFAIASVERAKEKCISEQPMGLCVLRAYVNAFQRVRLFFYSPKRECLFDSLVLVFYLCGLGFGPKLVFGVVVRPFRSHCWNEFGGHILNGGAEVAAGHHRIREL